MMYCESHEQWLQKCAKELKSYKVCWKTVNDDIYELVCEYADDVMDEDEFMNGWYDDDGKYVAGMVALKKYRAYVGGKISELEQIVE